MYYWKKGGGQWKKFHLLIWTENVCIAAYILISYSNSIKVEGVLWVEHTY